MLNIIRSLKAKKGFTLVELIVVIAIIAILTAILIPLIARYAAQASYVTLQDTARTVADSANNALADGNQVDAINITLIEGVRENGELSITLYYDATEKAMATISQNGVAQDATGIGNKGEKRAAERMCDSLAVALPDNCAFLVSVNNSAVNGVIYINTSSTVPAAPDGSSVIIGAVDGFDDAYAYDDGNGSAVGVYGKYKPD
ncbi:MAG: prepilin-type N-terminal cleavage/methylation domain-containing protein [Oscillospiraceae bacterium]|nr:prepilin-type N-terminal cleavage/methylation domain-containing protein [Oscillospiraceae bacterium]